MPKNKKGIGSDLTKVDAHTLRAHEYDEIPELTEQWFEGADLYHGKKLVKRGRPRKENPKTLISLRLDKEIIAAFKAHGSGWQSEINKVLSGWVKKHP